MTPNTTHLRLWHGGVPGLRPGDTITPGHTRKTHPGCPWCAAREAGHAGPGGIDPPSRHQDRVYVTTHRDYARLYASLYGRGDLYRVNPVGDLVPSEEATIESFTCPAAVVTAVYDRAVLLTWTQRRSLVRYWAEADKSAARGAHT